MERKTVIVHDRLLVFFYFLINCINLDKIDKIIHDISTSEDDGEWIMPNNSTLKLAKSVRNQVLNKQET